MYKIEYYNGLKLIETTYKPNIQLAKWYVKQSKTTHSSGTFKICKV